MASITVQPLVVRSLALLLGLMLLAGCGSNPERAERSTPTYTVRRGDTLSAIAARHKLDYRELARWNRIGRDYVIHPGQTLRLSPPDGRVAARTPAPKVAGLKAGPKASGSKTVAPKAARPKTTIPRAVGPKAAAPLPKSKLAPRKSSAAPAANSAKPSPPRQPATPSGPPVKWQWPVAGGTATLTSRPNGGNGLMIVGKLGDDIRSAGNGRVVYTGSGLLGYGQLIIVKHNESYLSAYGHLQSVAIKEGDAVLAGQRIATMGNGPQGSPLLYFEIRVNGSPSNPLSLLPQR